MNLLVSAILFFMIFPFAFVAYAHEPKEGTIFGTLGPYLYQTIHEQESPILGGFGIVAEGDVDKNGGLEIGMIYMHKIYYREHQGNILAEKIKRMDITLGYRHWFTDRFSGALAFSSAYSMGDAEVVGTEVPAGVNISTTAEKITEYGLNLSLLMEVLRFKDFALTVDSRYTWSLNHKSREDADVAGVLIGMKFFIQENQTVPPPDGTEPEFPESQGSDPK